MRNFIITLALIIFTAPFLRGEEVPLTLNEAVAIALRDNRDILLKEEEVKKAKLKISEAWSDIFPSLNFLGGWTGTKGLTQKDLALTTTQTTVKQALFQGGKIINTIRYNGDKFEVNQSILDKAKLEVKLDVEKAFYTLLLAGESAELNRQIVENTRQHLEFIRSRYQSGEAAESEALKIEAALSNAEEAFRLALSEAESAQALLVNLLYLDKDVLPRPQGGFAYEKREVAYDQAFLQALKRRPEIRQYEAQEHADRHAIEIAKAGGRPVIYASWEYFSRSLGGTIATAGTVTSASGGSKHWNDYNTTGLVFSWPVFDGWATRAKVEQAVVDLKQTRLLKGQAVKGIALELKNAYLALKDGIAKIEAAESDLKFYADNLSSAREQYRHGIASGLGLSDADLKNKVAQFNKNQAVYDYLIAKSSFEKAVGGADARS